MWARAKRRVQLGLPLGKVAVGWGGKREGAGRKKTGKTYVAHRTRPFHEENRPMHVTYRVVRGVPNLRAKELAAAVMAGISTVTRKVRRARTFRVCHFSVQSSHVHMLVEATSKQALSRGMQGLASGIARRVNYVLDRRGKVFAERYHARELASPTEVRNALAYVLLNRAHHARPGPGEWIVDDCSSGPWFTGWAWEPYGPEPPDGAPVTAPRTWLLSVGWRRARRPGGRGGGPRWLDPREVPGE